MLLLCHCSKLYIYSNFVVLTSILKKHEVRRKHDDAGKGRGGGKKEVNAAEKEYRVLIYSIDIYI